MLKYLFHGSYMLEGVRGLLKVWGVFGKHTLRRM